VKKAKKNRPFLTIATIDGTPLRRATPYDPEEYAAAVKKMEDNGMKPPVPFRSQRP